MAGNKLSPSARAWLAPATALGLVVAVLAALGGLRLSVASAGPTLEIDQTIRLTNWAVAIHAAELGERTPGLPGDQDVLRVWATLTRTAEESRFLPPKLIGVQVDTAVPPAENGFSHSPDRRATMFDPEITREIELLFDYPDPDATLSGVPPAPAEVRVLVHDERPGTGFLNRDSVEIGDLVGHVRLPCPDHRLPG